MIQECFSLIKSRFNWRSKCTTKERNSLFYIKNPREKHVFANAAARPETQATAGK